MPHLDYESWSLMVISSEEQRKSLQRLFLIGHRRQFRRFRRLRISHQSKIQVPAELAEASAAFSVRSSEFRVQPSGCFLRPGTLMPVFPPRFQLMPVFDFRPWAVFESKEWFIFLGACFSGELLDIEYHPSVAFLW
jgi:hypothetical protein